MAEEILNQDQEQAEQQAPQQEEPPKKLSVGEFAAKIKSKYPEYKDIDDSELTSKMLSKFPVYKDQVDFTEKKNVGQPSRIGGQEQKTSINPPTPSQSPSSLQEGEEKPKEAEPEYLKLMNEGLFNRPKSDATYVQKQVTGEKIEQVEKYKKNLQVAIDNTAERALKNKGIQAPKNSPAYIKQRKKIEDAIKNGDAVYTIDPLTKTPALSQTTGFLTSAWNSLKSATQDENEAEDFTKNMNTTQRIEYAENRLKKIKPTEEGYIGETPTGIGGKSGELLGGALPFITKVTAGTTAAAGLIAAAPETAGASLVGLPAVMGFAASTPSMIYQGGRDEVIRRYDLLKNG